MKDADVKRAIASAEAALAEESLVTEPEQEPVAYSNPQVKGGFYLAKPTKITAPINKIGLDYQTDWKEEYQKAVYLHCITLNELREANFEIKRLIDVVGGMALEISKQDALLERQTARIVDLQTHIKNFDGEDR